MKLEFTGLDEILRNLGNLPLEEADENKIVREGAKIVQKAIIEEAPYDDGTVQENIKFTRVKEGQTNIHTGGAYHAHLIQDGRSPGRKIAVKSGKRQYVTWGATNPNPFFTRGFEKSKEEAKTAMAAMAKKVLNL